MSAVPANGSDTLRRVAAGAPVGVHADDPAQARPVRDTGAAGADLLPDSPIARRLAELAATLHKAGQLVETLSRDANLCLANLAPQSVSVDMPEVVHPTRAKPQPQVQETLLTVADVAVLLRLDERTVRRHRKQGLLPPAIDLGGVLRWRKADIDAWLDARREGAVT